MAVPVVLAAIGKGLLVVGRVAGRGIVKAIPAVGRLFARGGAKAGGAAAKTAVTGTVSAGRITGGAAVARTATTTGIGGAATKGLGKKAVLRSGAKRLSFKNAGNLLMLGGLGGGRRREGKKSEEKTENNQTVNVNVNVEKIEVNHPLTAEQLAAIKASRNQRV